MCQLTIYVPEWICCLSKLCLGEAGQLSERHHDGEGRGQLQLRVSDKEIEKEIYILKENTLDTRGRWILWIMISEYSLYR